MKKNRDSVKNAVQNDLFSSAPMLEKVFAFRISLLQKQLQLSFWNRKMKNGIEQMFSALNSIVKRVENADENRLETLNSITSISSVIQETTASVETVASVAEKLMVYVKQLDNMAVALDKNMGELSREVEKFVVE